MTELQKRLFLLSEEKYAKFISNLTPTVSPEQIIGVRSPILHKIAKEMIKDGSYKDFIESVPHKYYEENMLHSGILSNLKDLDYIYNNLEKFLPYIDNWAVCDTLRPKIFSKNKENVLPHIIKWISSSNTYTCRFGIQLLMNDYLDSDFDKSYFAYPLKVRSEEYYVNMMVAWYFATALAKQWDSTVYIIENKLLPKWTHNKTIQKAIESNRITPEQKNYLREFKIK